MGYLDSLNITGSALTAERFRTDVILQNMAKDVYKRQCMSLPARVLSMRKETDFHKEALGRNGLQEE